mgnify:CR=1 FL=1
MICLEHTTAIELRHITKRFGKVVANDDISLEIRRGEILSLLGENGSGKTTLMNMISGIYFPDEGHICVGGREVTIRSPKDAYALGIGMIHQHFKLVDVFTAAENIVLGLEGKGAFDLRAAARRVKEISEKYGFDIDPGKKVYDMSVSEKQTVEILKVLYRGADILILDEPTAVLTPQETEKLFAVLRNMRADGKAIVIITHKLHEVMALSDRVAVLRKGKYIGTVNTADTDPQKLTEMMVGRAVSLNIDRPEAKYRDLRLEVKGLTCRDHEGVKTLDDVSFQAFGGEILGIAGIAGSGQKELLEAIAGLQAAEAGSAYNVEAGAIDRMYVNGRGHRPDVRQPDGPDRLSQRGGGRRHGRRERRRPAGPRPGAGAAAPHQRQRLSIPAVGHGGGRGGQRQGGGAARRTGDGGRHAGGQQRPGALGGDCGGRDSPHRGGAAHRRGGDGDGGPEGGEREVTVAAQVSLTGGAGAGAVQDAFRAALAGYLHTLIEGKYGAVYYKPADDQPYTLLYNRVLALLLNVEGVENFASLTVNGGTADVTIQAGEIPVLGEVSVT